MVKKSEIYLATVLLEKNRWSSRVPSFRLSEWLNPIQQAGFDGLELWENHLLLAEKGELQAVIAGPLPVRILNSYCGFEDGAKEARVAAAKLAKELAVPAVKFNFGKEVSAIASYRDNLLAWRDLLPAGCRLLCECHPYTVLENMEEAAAILEPLKGQLEIIVHLFGNRQELKRRIALFGKGITHIHVAGSGVPDQRYSPLEGEEIVPQSIQILREAGFNGSWTIEFCQGVAVPGENMPELLAAATRDLNTLRRELA